MSEKNHVYFQNKLLICPHCNNEMWQNTHSDIGVSEGDRFIQCIYSCTKDNCDFEITLAGSTSTGFNYILRSDAHGHFTELEVIPSEKDKYRLANKTDTQSFVGAP
jgi:hypothetical protein